MKAVDFDRIEQAVQEVAPDAIFTRTSAPSSMEIDILDMREGDSLHITVYLDYPSPHIHGWAHGICGSALKAVMDCMTDHPHGKETTE